MALINTSGETHSDDAISEVARASPAAGEVGNGGSPTPAV